MDKYYKIIVKQLQDIDVSKIPSHVYYSIDRPKSKTETVILYIHGIKKFIKINLKDLRKKRFSKATILSENVTFITTIASTSYYYFYNIDKFQEDYPYSGIEIFAKQKDVYYDLKHTDYYLMKYAKLYQEYNCLEKLVKAGFADIIFKFFINTDYCLEEVFNIKGKNIVEITGLQKAICKTLIERIDIVRSKYIELKNLINNYNLTPYQVNRLLDLINNRYPFNLQLTNDLLQLEYQGKKLYSFNSLMNYLEKQTNENQLNNFQSLLYDYIKMCLDLNIKPNTKSKHLYIDHDLTVIQYNQLKDKITEEKYKNGFNRQYKKLKQFEYHDNRLQVLVPKKPKDIIEEGKNNHNCVGTYVDRHASGNSNIFFVRKIDDICKSYITVELDKTLSRVSQAYYSYNRKLTNSDNDFINSWMKNVVLKEVNK